MVNVFSILVDDSFLFVKLHSFIKLCFVNIVCRNFELPSVHIDNLSTPPYIFTPFLLHAFFISNSFWKKILLSTLSMIFQESELSYKTKFLHFFWKTLFFILFTYSPFCRSSQKECQKCIFQWSGGLNLKNFKWPKQAVKKLSLGKNGCRQKFCSTPIPPNFRGVLKFSDQNNFEGGEGDLSKKLNLGGGAKF